MKLLKLNKRPMVDKKLDLEYSQFEKLLNDLNKRELPAVISSTINNNIEEINSFAGTDKELRKRIHKIQSQLIQILGKELKLVIKNHYLIIGLSVGMAAFGIPIGLVFGTIFENMGFIGLGLPMGMMIGMLIGFVMDKKAYEEGRQLNLER